MRCKLCKMITEKLKNMMSAEEMCARSVLIMNNLHNNRGGAFGLTIATVFLFLFVVLIAYPVCTISDKDISKFDKKLKNKMDYIMQLPINKAELQNYELSYFATQMGHKVNYLTLKDKDTDREPLLVTFKKNGETVTLGGDIIVQPLVGNKNKPYIEYKYLEEDVKVDISEMDISPVTKLVTDERMFYEEFKQGYYDVIAHINID